jgi:hypothetical protein
MLLSNPKGENIEKRKIREISLETYGFVLNPRSN